MSKKKRKNTDSVALRREIEALKAQLKEYGVEPAPLKSETEKTSGLDYQQINKTSKRSEKSEGEIDIQKIGKATYLKKDFFKTMTISVFIITSIVVIKFLKLF